MRASEFNGKVNFVKIIDEHFRYCANICQLYKRISQCKFSLYLKKAGLASQNIVTFKP